MRRSAVVLGAVFSVILGYALALDNGLGKTPGMGWNSDYCVGCGELTEGVKGLSGYQNEDFIMHIADTMHNGPWQKLNFRYVNMDASWDTKERDSSGNLVPDPNLWPHGLPFTVSYVHSLGLGFGLYGDRGTHDCAGNPGNDGHVQQDAQFYADMKIDWYKSDSCSAPGDEQTAVWQYGNMSAALNATGRPIWFALCGWKPWYAPPAPALGYKGGKSIGNSWRIGPDTVCGWSCVMENVNNGLPLGNYSGPSAHGGGHNDMCLLLLPQWGKGSDLMTNDRHRSQFSLWSVMGANLLVTGNLSVIDPFAVETWTNAEVIATNQDPAGYPYRRLTPQSQAGAPVLPSLLSDPRAMVAECGGEPQLQNWTWNKPAVDYLYNAKTNMCVNVDDCHFDLIFDGCSTGPTCAGNSKFNNQQFQLESSGQLVALLRDSDNCATVNSDRTVSLTACASPVPTSQSWKYDAATGQLISAGGLCMTGPSSTPPVSETELIVARPLSDGSVTAVFLNNNANATHIVCGEACWAGMGLAGGVKSVSVRDLWQHKVISSSVAVGTPYDVLVSASGASMTLNFKPAEE